MIPVLTPGQSSDWDARASRGGIPLHTLMETAGRAVAAIAAERFAEPLSRGALVAAGPGNNGGDGWVVARALHAAGAAVWVAQAGEPAGDLPRTMARLAREAGVRELAADGPWPAVGLVIDALLGTGGKLPLREPITGLAARLADLAVPILAVDGPTGLGLEDGVQHGPFRATLTVTFGGCRRGHLLARDEIGDLVVADIGLPAPDPAWPLLFTDARAAERLGRLEAGATKWDRGRIAVVGGDAGMTGAARMAARAAFATGAGLVHVVAPRASVQTIRQAEPDVQTVEQEFDAPLTDAARALLERCDAVVAGPGLGRDPSRVELVERVVAAAGSAGLVLDADALMAFGGKAGALERLLAGRRALLTPHAGEFRAIQPEDASVIAVDPWGAASRAAARLGAVVLLKGVPTVVADPGGAVLTVAAGNPGLATGGSGDTLSGVAAVFLGQGIEPRYAAALAAQALGDAGDFAARRTSARAMRPMDVIAALPDVWRRWDRLRETGGVHPPILHELPAPTGT
ncbi:MAG: NAD(P)H-hydrate dehydratase [Gemmatimonadales bacterium]